MLKAYHFVDKVVSQTKRKFSTTHLVEERETGHRFILKVAALNDKKAMEMLKNESQFEFKSSSCLQSSLKYWEEGQKLYVLKEYLEGENLLDFYKSLKKSDRKEFVPKLIAALCKLLEELHDLQILHLDLKASNIIIEGNLKDFHVRLIDFGLAWDLKKNIGIRRKSFYPFGHAAPELILNVPDIFAPQTDFYALGILLYELLEEELPFMHSNPVQSINLQLNLPLPLVSRKWRKYQNLLHSLTAKESFLRPPNQLTREDQKKVLLKGMAKRYTHTEEIRNELENIYSVPEL